MKKIRLLVFIVRKKIIVLENKLRLLFLKNQNSILYIASSKDDKNEVKEDLCLQREFLKMKIACKIEDYERIPKGSKVLIRSIWGYQNNLDSFKKFLASECYFINSKELIENNYDKKKQFAILEKYKLPYVPTKFIKDINELPSVTQSKYVLKPVISASGENTIIYDKNTDKAQIKGLLMEHELMFQPFIDEVKNGELALVLIGEELLYGIIRYPGIFTNQMHDKYVPISNIDQEAIELINKIKRIKEFKSSSYMRVDLIKTKGQYLIMEIELLDPFLHIESITDKKYKQKVYTKFASEVIRNLKDYHK